MGKIFALALILVTTLTCAQKDFSRLSVSKDSTYGYTAANPLKMKRGNHQKSIGYSYDFLSGLKTKDNRKLKFLQRLTIGKAADKGRQLDKYIFLTSEKDTLTIYVDLHSKDNLRIPVGLQYR